MIKIALISAGASAVGGFVIGFIYDTKIAPIIGVAVACVIALGLVSGFLKRIFKQLF